MQQSLAHATESDTAVKKKGNESLFVFLGRKLSSIFKRERKQVKNSILSWITFVFIKKNLKLQVHVIHMIYMCVCAHTCAHR